MLNLFDIFHIAVILRAHYARPNAGADGTLMLRGCTITPLS